MKPYRVLCVKAKREKHPPTGIVPPVGLLYLASVLRQHRKFEVYILDCWVEKDPIDSFRRALQEINPHVVGISATTLEFSFATKLANLARMICPKVKVVIGGPHAIGAPLHALKVCNADAVVVGEGEAVIADLVEALANNDKIELQGVITSEGGEVTFAPRLPLDEIPLPAWDMLDFEPYFALPSMATPSPWRYAPIMTSRGCPWQCTFCHNIFGKKLRTRSKESMEEELRLLEKRIGHGFIEVLDDCPNASRKHFEDMLDIFIQKRERLRVTFPNGLRIDRLDDETINLLCEARCAYAGSGIESGDPEMQILLRKNLDLEKARENIEKLDRKRIYTCGFFLVGLPNETFTSFLKTLRFALEVPLCQAYFLRLVPLPGSVLFAEMGGRIDGIDEHVDYFGEATQELAPNVRSLQRLALFLFYSRPSVWERILHRHPNKKTVLYKAFFASFLFSSPFKGSWLTYLSRYFA